MKCFIASAFGRDDVDAIYDRCILPVLKKLYVTPLRVDRVEHNEEIDNKIFELLDSADFVIADLTYARPSVYYEAGYAAGKSKPVIYIAKGDHFRAHDDDIYGNFRIHFDLQMKNIIPWKSPERIFSDKLHKRVRLVLRPFERASALNRKLETDRSEFNGLPIYDRLDILKETCVNHLRARSFHSFEFDIDTSNGTIPTRMDFLQRVDNTRYQGVGIFTTSSATKQFLQPLSWSTLYEPFRNHPKLKKRETHYIVVSLKSIPRPRITEALPSFHQENNATLVLEKKSTHANLSTTFVHIIDGVKSKSEFVPALRDILNQNDL
jgi:hypothetical protein